MKAYSYWIVIAAVLTACAVNPEQEGEFISAPDEVVENTEDYVVDSTFDWGDFSLGDEEEYVEPAYNPSRRR